jgi:hypothetical protein
MVMQRWEQVYNELERKASRLGYKPPLQLGSGNSQVFEFRRRGEPALLLAFRDLARKEDYKVHNRLWAEGLELVLRRYTELAAAGKPLPQAAAIVIDNLGDSFIVVMMNELLELYRRKGAFSPDHLRRFTFVIQREPEGYYLQMPYGETPVKLTAVNSVDSLVLLLKAAATPPSR